ncbi:MAG: Fic family protein [Chitinophagaceae bacterium]
MNFIIDEMANQVCFDKEIQLFQLLNLISPEAYAQHPNKYRQVDVQVGNHLCPSSKDVPFLVNELFYRLTQINNPIIKAIYLHHELIRIHPFADGNGRVTRMAKNWILMYYLYPPIFIKDTLFKKEYVDTLSKSFYSLYREPNQWNDNVNIFFEQEIDRIITNCEEIYCVVYNAGSKRKL